MAKEAKEKKSGEKFLIKRPLKFAAISGILLFILLVFNSALSQLFANTAGSLILGALSLLFSLSFTYGFFVLAVKHNSKLLKVISIALIVTYLAYFLWGLFAGNFLAGLQSKLQNKAVEIGIDLSNLQNVTQEQSAAFSKISLTVLAPFLAIILIYGLAFLIFSILFGVGILKLGNTVKYAKTAGILQVIGAPSIVLFLVFSALLASGNSSPLLSSGLLVALLGSLCLVAAVVFELIILFQESKKFE